VVPGLGCCVGVRACLVADATLCQCWITNGYEADAAIVFATTDKSAKHKGISGCAVTRPSCCLCVVD
jgi:hypothetical protein